MKELGVLVPVVTPCTRAGEVNIRGLQAVCRYVLNAGCNAVFVAGSTGRGPWWSRSDRARMCMAAAEVVAGGSPVFAGCMASGLTEMLENAYAMQDAGADIAVLTAPGYFNYSQEEVESIFLRFADQSPLPVMIYDIPAFVGMKLDVGMVTRLARHENVVGFKDSSADMDRFRELLDALGDIEDFYLLQGKEHLLAESVMGGASGFVVSLLHVDPRPFVALYQKASAREAGSAAQMQRAATEILGQMSACVEKRPQISTLFHFLNHALVKHGVCRNILLEHEGECPEWLAEASDAAMAIAEEAVA